MLPTFFTFFLSKGGDLKHGQYEDRCFRWIDKVHVVMFLGMWELLDKDYERLVKFSNILIKINLATLVRAMEMKEAVDQKVN